MPDVQPLVTKRRVRSKQGGTENATHASEGTNPPRDWTIKSLPLETVEISRDAARRSGMKINAWVNKALENAAAGPGGISSMRATDELELLKLEQSILREISDLKIQNNNLVQTVNSISSMLLKMYDKID